MAVITTSAFFLSDLPSKKRVRNVEPSQPPPPLVSEPEEIINSDDHVLCRDCGRGGSISGSGGLRIALKCSFCDYGLHKHHTHARVSPYVDGDESREFCSKNCKRDWARQRIHRLSMIAGINPSDQNTVAQEEIIPPCAPRMLSETTCTTLAARLSKNLLSELYQYVYNEPPSTSDKNQLAP